MSAPGIAYELFAEAGHATTILIVVLGIMGALGITVCLGIVWRARRLGDQCGQFERLLRCHRPRRFG